MKITIEAPSPGQEDEIIIRVTELSEDILEAVKRLKNADTKDSIALQSGDAILMVPIRDILYFDAVDNRVFAYTKEKNYEMKMKLYEIEEDYSFSSFIRVSKNTIINIKKIDHLSPEFNGRFIAKLINGEKILISRSYVPLLKKKLGIVR